MISKTRFFILCIYLLGAKTLLSVHIRGAEISYKYLGNNKYELEVITYRECNGPGSFPVGPPINLKVESSCGTSTFSITNLIQVSDATGIGKNCSLKTRCNGGGSIYGVEKRIFKDTIDLSNDTCSIYEISYEGCCRVLTTTFNIATDTEVKVKINKLLKESSPKFLNPPVFFYPVSEQQFLSFEATGNSDSTFVSYEQLTPITKSNLQYINPWSATRPLTFQTFPRNWDQFPGGIRFDTTVGNLSFKPVVVNQVTPIVIRAKKWKFINGKKQIVSESIREIIVTTTPNVNSLPNFNTYDNTYIFCPDTGRKSIDINIHDNDSTDSLSLRYYHNLGSNLISINDSGSRNSKVLRLEYLIDSNVIKRTKISTFTVEANDNVCDYNGTATKAFIIKILPYLQDSFSITKNLRCRLLKLEANNNSSVNKPIISWEIASTKDTIIRSQPITSFDLPDTGWYKIRLEVSSDEHCSKRLYYDSIYLSQAAFLEMKAPADTSLCFNPSINIQPTVINGTPPINYNWSTGDTTPTITVLATAQANQYWVSVTDANNCSVAQDTVNIFYYNPKVSLSGNSEVCIRDTIQLQAILSDTTKPTFGWVGFNSSTQLSDNPTNNKIYTFSLTDFAGCKIDTTWNVKVYNPKIKFTHNADVCRGDSLTFSAQADSGKPPYSYNWVTLNKMGQSVKIATQGLGLGFVNATLEVTDSFGCMVTGSTKAFVKPKPTVSTSAIASKCIAIGQISLIPYGTPAGGFWIGKGVDSASSNLNPQISDTGVHLLVYVYTNNFNCTDSSGTTIKIEQENKADFVANKTVAEEGDTVKFTNISTAKDINNSKWDFGDPNSSNNTFTGKDASHTYNDSGLYTIQLIVSGGVCPDDTLIKVDYTTINKKSTISVKELSKNVLKLYPNPAKDKLTIEAETEIVSIKLIDALGREYRVKDVKPETKQEINLSSFAMGVYIIKAKDSEGYIYTSKVQISR